MRRFSRRLFGADSREVREFLAETAAELDRARTALAQAAAERDTLQTRLREVAAEVDRLRGQVAAAHEKITAHHAQEGLIAQVVAERDALFAEREILRTTLRQISSEVDGLRGQMTAAEEKIADAGVYQDETLRLAAERDGLQKRLKEATAELHRLREQAAAARDKIAAYQARKDLATRAAVERDSLRRALRDITAEAGALRDQLTAAQAKIAAYQAEDREIAQTLLSAQKAADDLIRAAQARAEDILGSAGAQAEEMTQAARRAAAETLRKAQVRAESTIRAAEEVAAARLARMQIETGWLAAEAHRTAEDERSAEHAGGDERPASASALPDAPGPVERHGHTAETAGMVSTLHMLVDAIGGGVREALSVPRAPGGDETRASAPSDTAGRQRGETPAQDRVVPLGIRGEIVVSPVRTYYRATKIAEAVSRMKGIRVARLRGLQGDAASIEVITESGTLTGIDCAVIDGVPMNVLEATDARTVLRVARISQSIPS